ncbi:hypothetical protein D3C87_1255810 [compost metagenome]
MLAVHQCLVEGVSIDHKLLIVQKELMERRDSGEHQLEAGEICHNALKVIELTSRLHEHKHIKSVARYRG